MDADHERILTLIAAALLGALLGGPALTLIRALLKAVGQLAVVAILVIGVLYITAHGWPPPWNGVNTSPTAPTGTEEEALSSTPASGPWWQPPESTAR